MSNHRVGRSLILERLDRCFANQNWIQTHLNASVTHLPRIYSDHSPLLVQINISDRHNNSKPFRLENCWYDHCEFKNIVSGCWLNNDHKTTYSNFVYTIKNWSKVILGGFLKRKKKKNCILARFKRIQKNPLFSNNDFLVNLNMHLIKEYNDLLKIEEDHWCMRSRINWINDGTLILNFITSPLLIVDVEIIFLFLKMTMGIGSLII